MATIPLALYLWKRIRELGTGSIMGVPGDFNMQIMDFIYEVPGLKWTGNANELNAAYAADGYARVSGSPGCLVTTHGVGELSALNGIAGSMCEHVPVIHVVGQTSRPLQEKHLMIHHSIGTKPDHQLYNKTTQHLRCAAAELWDPAKAPAEIDRVLRECVIQKLPVCIFFPLDLAGEQVPANLLEKPLDLSFHINTENENKAIKAITERLSEAKNPSILVDFLTAHHAKKETREFVDAAKLPTYVPIMARTVIDETHPCYVGAYNGAASSPGVAEAVEESDFVLALGWWLTDTNSGAFTRNLAEDKRIDVMDDHVMIDGKKLDGVFMAPLITKLAEAVPKLNLKSIPKPRLEPTPKAASTNDTKITHKHLWPRFSDFLRPGDVLLVDTGTAQYGLVDATLPKDSTWLAQTYYMSIGWATPAALGAAIALKELQEADKSKPAKRTILVTGDGSLQLTLGEIGSMITHDVHPLIIIINNAGYSIERAIHGAHASYNDINAHNYSHLLHLYSAPNPSQQFRRVTTREELEKALNEDAVIELKELQLIEVVMDMMDLPRFLKQALERRGLKTYLEEEGFKEMEA